MLMEWKVVGVPSVLCSGFQSFLHNISWSPGKTGTKSFIIRLLHLYLVAVDMEQQSINLVIKILLLFDTAKCIKKINLTIEIVPSVIKIGVKEIIFLSILPFNFRIKLTVMDGRVSISI